MAPDHDALSKVLLQEGVNAEDGKDDDNDGGVLGLHGFHGQLKEVAVALGHLVLSQYEKLDQIHLKGLKLNVGDVEEGVEIAVPVAHRVKESEHGHNGLGQGNHDLPEDGGFAGAIDGGGFHETLGDAREEGAGKDHVEDADGAGENHGPAGVVEAQVFDEKKVGDHTAAEEGGEDDHHGDEVASPETFAGEGVGGHTGEDDVDEREL